MGDHVIMVCDRCGMTSTFLQSEIDILVLGEEVLACDCCEEGVFVFPSVCEYCGGEGKVIDHSRMPREDGVEYEKPCQRCNGTGVEPQQTWDKHHDDPMYEPYDYEKDGYNYGYE